MLGLGGATEDEKVINLINAVEELKKKVDIPSTLKEVIQVCEKQKHWGAEKIDFKNKIKFCSCHSRDIHPHFSSIYLTPHSPPPVADD